MFSSGPNKSADEKQRDITASFYIINEGSTYLGGEEQRGCGDGIPVELREGVECEEPVHIYYRRVDA